MLFLLILSGEEGDMVKVNPERIARARLYVKEVRAKTYCAVCGSQPFDWHSDRHLGKKHLRVGHKASNGASNEVLQREIDQCIPLCRSCHMKKDGRTAELRRNCPYQKDVFGPAKICIACGAWAGPMRHGRCGKCAQRFSKATKDAALSNAS
jgi:hypothetical protein